MCNYNDCGWCYAKGDVEKNDTNGACNAPKECPQFQNTESSVIMSTTDL